MLTFRLLLVDFQASEKTFNNNNKNRDQTYIVDIFKNWQIKKILDY